VNEVAVKENLTRDEAAARAAMLEVSRTDVGLVLPIDGPTFRSTSTVTFEVRSPGSTFLDLTARSIERIAVDGIDVPIDIASATRVPLVDLAVGSHTVTVDATMDYRHEGSGLHRFVDPSDGLVYLHSQFEPFDAHLVFACFDQPDLKTAFGLVVDAPAGWVVVSNEAAVEQPDAGEAGRWTFSPTPRISTYITAVVAGAYEHVHDTHVRADGRRTDLGLYVRRSLAEHLDADELFALTKAGFDHFETVFDQPYPFGKYDQLFVPEFSAGAMENPGAVTFSESYVFRSKVTDAIRERRAETLLHEMAHMWFGDLVTMRWWDDLWLNESFATFMAVHAQVHATRWRDSWVTFLDAEKAWAKVQDDLPSTHPVADEMPDVESVHQNFDGITYAKGASVLRQLVAWVGEDAFLAGCRAYFARHAWSNTVLADFLAALESASGRDLGPWRDEWLRTTGINRLATEVEVDDEGRFTVFRIVQTDPAPPWRTEERAPILRSHRIAIGLYRDRAGRLVRDERIEIDVQGAITPVDVLIGVERPDLIVINDDDLTFAKVSLDEVSLATMLAGLRRIDAAMPRALVWANAWDMVRDAELPARSFVALVVGNAGAESDIGVLQRLLMRATAAAERFADPEARAGLRSLLVHHAREALDAATPGGERQLAFVRHWAWLADAEPTELGHLRDLIEGGASLPGLVLDADLRWHLVTCLAHTGSLDDAAIDAELARDDTDLGHRQAATARAARPDAQAKEAAWELLGDVDLSLTMSRHVWGGFMQLDQAEVLEPFVDRYFGALDAVWERRSLDWALEWSAGMFPHPMAGPGLLTRTDATLGRDDLPRPLRRVLLEQRDGLTRMLRARACDRAAGPSDPTG